MSDARRCARPLKSLSLLGLLEIRQGDGTYLRKGSSTVLPQVI